MTSRSCFLQINYLANRIFGTSSGGFAPIKKGFIVFGSEFKVLNSKNFFISIIVMDSCMAVHWCSLKLESWRFCWLGDDPIIIIIAGQWWTSPIFSLPNDLQDLGCPCRMWKGRTLITLNMGHEGRCKYRFQVLSKSNFNEKFESHDELWATTN